MAILSHQLRYFQYAMQCGIWANLCGVELDRLQRDLACFPNKCVPKRTQNLDTEVLSMWEGCPWRAQRVGNFRRGGKRGRLQILEVVWPLAATSVAMVREHLQSLQRRRRSDQDERRRRGSWARGLRVSGAHYYLKGRVLGRPTWEWEGSTSGGGGVLVRVFGYLETGGSLLRKRRVLGREASGEEGGLGEVEGIIAY